MRVAYADPPYLGASRKHYRDHRERVTPVSDRTAADIRELARLNHTGVHSCTGICLAEVVHAFEQDRLAPPLQDAASGPPAIPDPLPSRSCRHGIVPDQCEFCDSPGWEKEEATRRSIAAGAAPSLSVEPPGLREALEWTLRLLERGPLSETNRGELRQYISRTLRATSSGTEPPR